MSNARRIVVEEFGGPEAMSLVTEDLADPGPGEVQVRQSAIGFNLIDTYQRRGAFPLPLPTGIGFEAAGTVEAAGDGVDGIRVGERVAYMNAGVGAYADRRNILAEKLVRLPENVSDEAAASLFFKGMTAQYLVRKTHTVQAGDLLLVHTAAGAVGQILTRWATALGATVIGTTSSPGKRETALAAGCTAVIDTRDENWPAAFLDATGGRKARVVYDAVGKATLLKSLECAAPFGLVVCYGAASGPAPAGRSGASEQEWLPLPHAPVRLPAQRRPRDLPGERGRPLRRRRQGAREGRYWRPLPPRPGRRSAPRGRGARGRRRDRYPPVGSDMAMDIRALVAGFLFVAMWSSAFTSARIIVADAPPFLALSVRFAISGVLALAIGRALGQRIAVGREQWRPILVFGICQNALYLGLIFIAVQTVEASVAVVIASLLPLLVAALDRAVFGVRLSTLSVAGLMAGLAGVLVITEARLGAGLDPLGLAYCVGAVLALAIATLAVRGASAGGNLWIVVGLQMLVGSAALFPVSMLLETWAVNWTASMIGAFWYTVLIPGLAATMIWFWLVGRIGATRASTYHFLNPFLGVAIAAAVLGEMVTVRDLVGVAIIMVGILAVQLSRPVPVSVRG